MNNHMSLKLVGANSSLELNSPITSIYLQEELTGLTTLPGIRETKGMNIGMDGGWTSAQFYEPRLITVKGVIANQDVAVVEQRRKQLIQLLAEKRLALEFQTEAGNHYTMNVVVAGVQMPLSKVLTASYFQVNLRADDPLIYDNNALAELEAILRRSSSASSGFTINFPINFQLGTSESRPTIDNFGSSVIYPTITLTGPLTTPEIVNITTNMAFTIDEVLGAGTYTASGIRGAIDQEGSVNTYSGNPIQATRDAESPISKFSLYGNAEQTTYSGKNKLNYLDAVPATNQTTTTFIDNGFRSVTTSTGYATKITLSVKASTTYTLSWTVKKVSGTMSPFVRAYEGTGTSTQIMYVTSASDGSYHGSFTTASGVTQVNIWFYNGTPMQGTTDWTFIQLEESAAMTAYEPYVGGTASPNPDYPQPISVVAGENVVKITGKNLFGELTEYYVSYCSYTLANNILTITPADTTHNPGVGFSLGTPIPSGETVHLSSATSVGSSTQLRDSSNAVVANFSNGIDTTRTLSGTAERIVFNWLSTGSTTPFTVDLSTLQIELGSQRSAYEPYQGQEFEVNLGKNLLGLQNTSTMQQNGVTISVQNGTISLNGTASVSFGVIVANLAEDLRLTNGIDYAISMKTISGSANRNFDVQLRDNSDANIFSVNSDYFPVSRNTLSGVGKKLRLYFAYGTVLTNYKIAFQIELGTQATSYSAYFTPIELAKIGNYQDRIYKSEGKWYIEKQVGKVVFNGTENWTSQGGGAPYTIDMPDFDRDTNEIRAISDNFLGVKYNANWNNYSSLITSNSSSDTVSRFKFRYTAITSLADFKTWLSTHNTTVYYALATPTTTEITEQTLIDQLDAILEAHLYEGINNISNVAISPNLAGDLEIKTGQTLTVINALSIVGSSGTAEIDLGGAELAMVGSVADELTINGTTGAVTKTARIGKIESYAGETITTDYISTSGGLDSDATIYYVLPSSSTSVINTLDSTALAAFNGVVASGGVSAQTNIGSISVDVTTVTAQDVAVVDTKQHTVTINGVGAYSKFSGDWLTLDVGLNELQLITENNTDTGSAVIKYRVGYMGV